jgi:hypothetical protein
MTGEISKTAGVEETTSPVDVEKNDDTVYRVQSKEVDSSSSDVKELRTTKDGKTTLIPQPSDDPADPLNWSWGKKHTVLVALTFSALLTDWGMTWGSSLFEAQAETWNMTIPNISNSLSGGIFLQGSGGVLAVPLIQRYGR